MLCCLVTIHYAIIILMSRGVKGHLLCQEPEVMPPLDKPTADLEMETRALLTSYNQGVLKGVPCIFHNIHRQPVDVSTLPSNPGYDVDGGTSLCPSVYVNNTDENRVPNVLYEARCSQTQCGGCSRGSGPIRYQECKEIYYYVRVLRRTGCDRQTGVYQYRQVMEPLSAGCTCLAPASSLQLPTSSSGIISPGD